LWRASWPEADPAWLRVEEVEIPVVVNGRVRDRLRITAELGQDEVVSLAVARERVQKALGGRRPSRVVYVPGRTLSLVVGQDGDA
jgi:leucyl-tRNA synthetase